MHKQKKTFCKKKTYEKQRIKQRRMKTKHIPIVNLEGTNKYPNEGALLGFPEKQTKRSPWASQKAERAQEAETNNVQRPP